MNKIKRVAEAMQARRAELISQPLNRVWDELARVAIDTVENLDGWIVPSREKPTKGDGTYIDVMFDRGRIVGPFYADDFNWQDPAVVAYRVSD